MVSAAVAVEKRAEGGPPSAAKAVGAGGRAKRCHSRGGIVASVHCSDTLETSGATVATVGLSNCVFALLGASNGTLRR